LTETHSGKCLYEVLADDSSIFVLEATGFYAPGLNCSLFSPQAYFLQQKDKVIHGYSLNVDWSHTVLNIGQKKVSLHIEPSVRIPILRCYKDAMKTAESLATVCVTDESNQNLTNNQKNMLRWHWKLGHVGFQQLQWIGRQGWLGKVGELFGDTKVHPPKCASCQFGKQERTPRKGSTVQVDKQREGILSADKLNPGDLIFSDQYCRSVPGRVFGRRGASISSQTYCGGTLFCDAASGWIKVIHQVSLNAHETVAAKQTFEREANMI
jgi:hypothetical protein